MDAIMISAMLVLFGVVGVFANFIAGKMLSKSVAKATLFFVLGTVLIPIVLNISTEQVWLTYIVIAIWGFMYSPTFLNASTYMISSAPEALEFANSLATSFGNLGVSVGTILGGYVIAEYGVIYTPWVTLILGIFALLMMAGRYLSETYAQKRKIQSC